MSSNRYLRDELLAKAQRIIDLAKAENRDLTSTEVDEVERYHERIKAIDAGGKKSRSSELIERLASVKTVATGDWDDEAMSDGRQRFTIFGHRAKSHAVKVAAGLRQGQKSVLSGATVTLAPEPAVFDPNVQRHPTPPLTFLEVLPTVPREAAQYVYLRQTVRDSNAAVVPRGQAKPESVYTATPEPGRLSVFAHLSEPVDEYLLADNGALSAFLRAEMLYGLQVAVEDQVLNGDGTGENLTGLLNTTGVQHQAADTDPLTTLRAATTRLEVLGFTPSAYLLNPLDWQRIETARNASGSFDLGGPVDRAARTVWGVQVSLSTKLDEGQAIALDTSAVSIDTDETGVKFQAGAIGDDFARNQLRFRNEGRFGLSVYQPSAIVVADLVSD